jgi:hypothetical protein
MRHLSLWEHSSIGATQHPTLWRLRSLECVELRFDLIGPKNTTCKIHLSDTGNHPLWAVG